MIAFALPGQDTGETHLSFVMDDGGQAQGWRLRLECGGHGRGREQRARTRAEDEDESRGPKTRNREDFRRSPIKEGPRTEIEESELTEVKVEGKMVEAGC